MEAGGACSAAKVPRTVDWSSSSEGAEGVGASEKSTSERGSSAAVGDSSGKKRSRTEHSRASAIAYILSMVGLPCM